MKHIPGRISPKKPNFLVDLSGKVGLYDEALFSALVKEGCNVKLFIPGKGLVSFVPRKLQSSKNRCKRLLKVVEGLVNYCYLLIIVFIKRPATLHLQWLPYMEFCSLEEPVLKLFKSLSGKTKIVLTIHNVYPHDMSSEAKMKYNIRFRKACALVDEFIVHTDTSRTEVINEFALEPEKVNVCCHGVFVPDGIVPKPVYREGGQLNILQFGLQSYYKGTDILVDAVCGMDSLKVGKIDARIVGRIDERYLSEMKSKDPENRIQWVPRFISDNELYEEINRSDLIVFPYRAISQSGALLMALYFEKLIVCSDLPSFKETMQGGMDDILFFKSESPDSLRALIEKYIDNTVDEKNVHERVRYLKSLYSWESAAKATMNVYCKKQMGQL